MPTCVLFVVVKNDVTVSNCRMCSATPPVYLAFHQNRARRSNKRPRSSTVDRVTFLDSC